MVELEKRARREEVFVNRMEAKGKWEWKMEDMSRKSVNFFSFLSLHPSSVVNRIIHWCVLGGSGVMDGVCVCLTENATLLQWDGFGSGLVDHRSWLNSWTELFRRMKRKRRSGFI